VAQVTQSNDTLYALIHEVLRLPKASINDELDMAETGSWDSLSHMQLIAAVEDEYGIELTADEIIEMRSVGQIKSVLRAHSVDV
jgi:acyl carrier protein